MIVGVEFCCLWFIVEFQIGGDFWLFQEIVKFDIVLGCCIYYVVQCGFEVEIFGVEGVEVYDEWYYIVFVYYVGCGICQCLMWICIILFCVGY